MVKENKDLYQCEECGFDYTERERERESGPKNAKPGVKKTRVVIWK